MPHQDPEKKKAPGPIGPSKETPLPNDLLKIMREGVKTFETVAEGQRNESKGLIDLAQGAAKTQETIADTKRKDAKASVDLVVNILKNRQNALDLQMKKAEVTAATGFVDDTDFDSAVAAARPTGLYPGPIGPEPPPGFGEIDPRSERFNLFPTLKSLDTVNQAREVQSMIDDLLSEIKAGLKESRERSVINSPFGLGGAALGGLLNLLSLPVTAFSGGTGLGTNLLGGRGAPTRLDNALATLRGLEPLLSNQIGIARTNIDAQEGLDLAMARKLAARAKSGEAIEKEGQNYEFRRVLSVGYVQDLSDLSQELGGTDSVLWTGNAIDADGRRVTRGPGLQLLERFQQLNSPEAAANPRGKAELLKDFDNIMEGFYQGTGIELSFDVFDRTLTELTQALRAKHEANIKPGIGGEETRETFALHRGALQDFTLLLNDDFREFARSRFEKIKGKLEKSRKGPAEGSEILGRGSLLTSEPFSGNLSELLKRR